MTPRPENAMPKNSEPEATEVTDSVEPAIEPVKLTGHAYPPTLTRLAAEPAVHP